MLTTICPDAEQLAAFQAGRLKVEALNQIAAHLESCATCQTVMQNGSTSGDALVRELRQAQNGDAFTNESGCQRAIARVEAMAAGAATHTHDDTANNVPPAMLPMKMLGKYQLLEPIGQGGMGTVYKAIHTLLKRTVAIKVLPPNRLKDPQAVSRFRREIEAAGRLDHPHIVRTSDADEADGQHFLVMEWLAGQDLSKYVRERGPLPIEQACDFIRQAALGLECAHEHGMVHRDVKPSNLLLTTGTDGMPLVKVLDLGLALLHDNVAVESELTGAGQVMGTYDYIAPEQAMESHTVDARADIYSLGCTFYFLLTGKAPFHGKSEAKKLLAHQLEEPTPLAKHRTDVPAEVLTVVSKMMAKDPAKRHASMRELAASLLSPPGRGTEVEGVTLRPQAGISTVSSVVLVSQASGAKRERRPLLIAGSFLLGLVAVIALVYGIIRITTPEGDFIIDTDDPNMKFSVSKGVVTLNDQKTGRTYELKAVRKANGEYELDVRDVDADLSFTAEKLTIRRGQTLALTAKFERKREPGASPADNPIAADFALEFLEEKAFVDIPSLKRKNTGPFTLEAWARAKKLTAGQVLVRVGGNANTQLSAFDDHFAGAEDFNGHRSVCAKPGSVVVDRWSHVALVVDGKEMSLFVDGSKKDARSCGTAPTDDIVVSRLGAEANNDARFRGALREIRVSKIARYTTDFTPQKHFVTDKNTLALYHFDEGQGDVLKDSSGNNHHGKIVGAKWVKADGSRILPPGATPVDDAWIKRVQALPAEKQVDEVAAKLKELNPGFDGEVTPHFDAAGDTRHVDEIRFTTDFVTDISPVRALTALRYLNCGGSGGGQGQLTDLTPLKDMQITSLLCHFTRVTHLSPIKDLKLTQLNINGTNVDDLSHLKNMKLIQLHCKNTHVTDFSPLKSLPLRRLECDFRPERDTEILRWITSLDTINDKPAAKVLNEAAAKTPSVGEIRRYLGHKDGIRHVVFSPDGKSFLSSSFGELWLWDVDSTTERIRFPNTQGFVGSAGFSVDGERVVGTAQVGSVVVWDAKAKPGEKVGELARFKVSNWAEWVALSPDRPHVFYTTRNGGRIYDLDKKEELPTRFVGDRASLSKNGRRLLSADTRTLYLWDVDTGKDLSNVDCTATIFRLALAPDGRHALAAVGNNVLQWDMDEKKQGKRLDGPVSVMAVAISPDGKRALTGGFDKKMRLWDLQTGTEIRSFDGHTGPVSSVAFAPNGLQAISGSDDKTIRLWQLPTDEIKAKVDPPKNKAKVGEIRRYIGHKQEVRCVAWAPDGKSFFTGSFGEPWLWDVESTLERKRLAGHQGWVHGGAFSHDGGKVIAGGQGGILVMWEANSGKKLHDILSFKVGGPVENVVCPPDQPHVFFSDRGGVRVFDIDKKQDDPRRFQGERISLSKNGRRLLTCDGKTLYYWDAETGKEISSLQHTGHIISLALAPDGRNAAVSVGSVVTMWDMESKKMGKRIDAPSRVQALAILPDGKRVLIGGADGKLRLWSLETGKELHCFDGHTGPVLCIAIAPDGLRALSGSEDKSVRLWQLPTEDKSGVLLDTPGTRGPQPLATSEKHGDGVAQLAVSRDGTKMVTYSSDMVLSFWELDVDQATFKKGWKNNVKGVLGIALEPSGSRALLAIGGNSSLSQIDIQTGDMSDLRKGRHVGATRLVFSADGRRYLCADFHGGISLRDTQNGEVLREFMGHTVGKFDRTAPQVCFSIDGERILSSGADHTVRLWNSSNAEELKKLPFASAKKRFIALSPDGKQALISQDNDVQVWDLNTGKSIGEWKGHKDHVTALAYGPDGSWAVSASQDKTLRVWDVATGKELAKLEGHTGDVTCVVVAAQGRFIVSGSRDKTLRAWKWNE